MENNTAGNAQGHKLYNHNAMGDDALASYISEQMERADAPALSVLGREHFEPSAIRNSAASHKMPVGIRHAE